MREPLQGRARRRERCTCTHVGPRAKRPLKAPGLVSLRLSRSPFSPAPAPSPPRLPGSDHGASVTDSLASPEGGLASPRQRAPSVCGKTPPFSAPLEHLQASASCPTPVLSMKNRVQDRRGAEPHSQPAPRPGVTLTAGGTAAPAQAPRVPDPAQGRAWPGGGPGRGAREGARDRPRRGRTDSWRGRRSWGRRREGIHRSNFPEKQSTCSRSDSKRGKKVQLPRRTRGLAKYFSNGLGFSCACLKH